MGTPGAPRACAGTEEGRTIGDHLDAPILRVGSLEVPMPYALNLEDYVLPSVARVVEAVERVTYAK